MRDAPGASRAAGQPQRQRRRSRSGGEAPAAWRRGQGRRPAALARRRWQCAHEAHAAPSCGTPTRAGRTLTSPCAREWPPRLRGAGRAECLGGVPGGAGGPRQSLRASPRRLRSTRSLALCSAAAAWGPPALAACTHGDTLGWASRTARRRRVRVQLGSRGASFDPAAPAECLARGGPWPAQPVVGLCSGAHLLTRVRACLPSPAGAETSSRERCRCDDVRVHGGASHKH